MIILQWNARSLLSNGQEFKKFVEDMIVKPDVICIQETWFQPRFDFVLFDYIIVRRDRVGGIGGGCATFVRQGLPYKVLGIGQVQEYAGVCGGGDMGRLKEDSCYKFL